MYRFVYVMFRDLELITLDLLCFHSNTVSQYLEQTMSSHVSFVYTPGGGEDSSPILRSF